MGHKRPYDGYCESASERSVCCGKKVGAVYIMGGALATPGNIGNVMEVVMEANVRLDVKACYEVLTSKLPVVLVGLDVTRKTLFTYEDHERWHTIGTEARCSFMRA